MKLGNFKWILFQDNWNRFLKEHAEKKQQHFPFLETKPIYPKTFLFRNSEISFFEILLVTVNRTENSECRMYGKITQGLLPQFWIFDA